MLWLSPPPPTVQASPSQVFSFPSIPEAAERFKVSSDSQQIKEPRLIKGAHTDTSSGDNQEVL